MTLSVRAATLVFVRLPAAAAAKPGQTIGRIEYACNIFVGSA
ncbi:hypothetical protein P1J78_00040 [Psychromarinibacter sp. C21-152]|uniref:Uncharacterized protein n=1 Tax=Psychromarinibacter sediminicola TaxID=3033385 RepID=A0AAE3NMR7_9RHOB|nr:hypothetical protein [Psychromarinibacter sediminicola]